MKNSKIDTKLEGKVSEKAADIVGKNSSRAFIIIATAVLIYACTSLLKTVLPFWS